MSRYMQHCEAATGCEAVYHQQPRDHRKLHRVLDRDLPPAWGPLDFKFPVESLVLPECYTDNNGPSQQANLDKQDSSYFSDSENSYSDLACGLLGCPTTTIDAAFAQHFSVLKTESATSDLSESTANSRDQGQSEITHEVEQRTTNYENQVNFALKLGYSEEKLQKALSNLGTFNPGTEKLLQELLKLGQEVERTNSHKLSQSGVSCASGVESKSRVSQSASTGSTRTPRAIVIDGSNVAMAYGANKVFSCAGIKDCVDYFKNLGHTDIKVFAPLYRKEDSRSDAPISDKQLLEPLEREGILVWTPSRRAGNGRRIVCHDDRFILKTAVAKDAVIVSNDEFRDLAKESPEFKKVVEENLLMYSIVDGRYHHPERDGGSQGCIADQLLAHAQLRRHTSAVPTFSVDQIKSSSNIGPAPGWVTKSRISKTASFPFPHHWAVGTESELGHGDSFGSVKSSTALERLEDSDFSGHFGSGTIKSGNNNRSSQESFDGTFPPPAFHEPLHSVASSPNIPFRNSVPPPGMFPSSAAGSERFSHRLLSPGCNPHTVAGRQHSDPERRPKIPIGPSPNVHNFVGATSYYDSVLVESGSSGVDGFRNPTSSLFVPPIAPRGGTGVPYPVENCDHLTPTVSVHQNVTRYASAPPPRTTAVQGQRAPDYDLDQEFGMFHSRARRESISDSEINLICSREGVSSQFSCSSLKSALPQTAWSGRESVGPPGNFCLPSKTIWGDVENFSLLCGMNEMETPENEGSKKFLSYMSTYFGDDLVQKVLFANPHEKDPRKLCLLISEAAMKQQGSQDE